MPRQKQDESIRDDTARLDTRIPNSLLRRIESIAAFLRLTRQAALLVVLNEGCIVEERKMLDAEQAAAIAKRRPV